MAAAPAPSPSFSVGLRLARRLWPLVLALWLLPVLVLLPAELVIDASVGFSLGKLPPGDLPAGEAMLVGFEGLRPVAVPLGIELLAALLLLWQWNVVWRGGIVAWQLWSGGGPVRLSQLVGLGLGWWWRYLRYSLFTSLAGVIALGLVWWPVGTVATAAHGAMNERRMLWMMVVGFSFSVVVWLLWWSAGLRGAWLLGRPDRRSAVVAFWHGLVGVLRDFVPTFMCLAGWGIPLVAALALPFLLAILVDGFAGSVVSHLVLHLSLLAAGFCRVALLTAFAPVSGLVEQSSDGAAS